MWFSSDVEVLLCVVVYVEVLLCIVVYAICPDSNHKPAVDMCSKNIIVNRIPLSPPL